MEHCLREFYHCMYDTKYFLRFVDPYGKIPPETKISPDNLDEIIHTIANSYTADRIAEQVEVVTSRFIQDLQRYIESDTKTSNMKRRYFMDEYNRDMIEINKMKDEIASLEQCRDDFIYCAITKPELERNMSSSIYEPRVRDIIGGYLE